MAKLVDDLEQKLRSGGPRKHSEGHGGPCPLCDGERNVSVYFRFSVNGPNYGQGQTAYNTPSELRPGTRRKENAYVVIPGAQQGLCMECATALYLEVARKVGRWDRVRALEEADGEDEG